MKLISAKLIVGLSAFLVLAQTANAQKGKTDSSIHYSADKVESIMDSLIANQKMAMVFSRSADDGAYLVGVRTKSGDVEIHESWDDVAIVRSGRGVLKTGTVVKGGTAKGTEPLREWLGGEIENATERKIAPGDFIVIPAGLGHQYLVAPGDTLTYWTIKVKRPKNATK